MTYQAITGSLALLLLGFTSCTDEGADTAGQDVVQAPVCFAYNGRGDTVHLALTSGTGEVNGTLAYALAEKDRNSGTLRGGWSGDTLLAVYTFNSEGSISMREVAFLRRGQGLVEGYGPLTADGRAFTSRDSLNFPGGMPLSAVDCSE